MYCSPQTITLMLLSQKIDFKSMMANISGHNSCGHNLVLNRSIELGDKITPNGFTEHKSLVIAG